MKFWLKQFEWMTYAGCGGDARFISESSTEDEELEKVCHACRVRPECIQWAVEGEVSAVYVAGVRLPDPAQKRTLRIIHETLRGSLPAERELRGEDI